MRGLQGWEEGDQAYFEEAARELGAVTWWTSMRTRVHLARLSRATRGSYRSSCPQLSSDEEDDDALY